MGIENQNNQPEIREGADNSSKEHEDSARDNLLAEAQASAVADRSKDKAESKDAAAKSGDAGSKEGAAASSGKADFAKHEEFVKKVFSPEYKQELKSLTPEQLGKMIGESAAAIAAQEAKIAALTGAAAGAAMSAEKATFKK